MDWYIVVLFILVAVSSIFNTLHCTILGRRVDTVHKRIDMTLKQNGIFDFWNKS